MACWGDGHAWILLGDEPYGSLDDPAIQGHLSEEERRSGRLVRYHCVKCERQEIHVVPKKAASPSYSADNMLASQNHSGTHWTSRWLCWVGRHQWGTMHREDGLWIAGQPTKTPLVRHCLRCGEKCIVILPE